LFVCHEALSTGAFLRRDGSSKSLRKQADAKKHEVANSVASAKSQNLGGNMDCGWSENHGP